MADDKQSQAVYNLYRESGGEYNEANAKWESGYQAWVSATGGGQAQAQALAGVTQYKALTQDEILAVVNNLLGSGSIAQQQAVLAYIEAAYGVPPEEAYQAVSEVVGRVTNLPTTTAFSAPISLFKDRQDLQSQIKYAWDIVQQNYPDVAAEAVKKVVGEGNIDPDTIVSRNLAAAIEIQGGSIVIDSSFIPRTPYRYEAYGHTEPPLPPSAIATSVQYPILTLTPNKPPPDTAMAVFMSNPLFTRNEGIITIDKDSLTAMQDKLDANKAEILSGIEAPLNGLGGASMIDINYHFRGVGAGIQRNAAPTTAATPAADSWEGQAFNSLMYLGNEAIENGQTTGYVTLSEPEIIKFFDIAQSYPAIANHVSATDLLDIVRTMPRDNIQLVNDVGSRVLMWQYGANDVAISHALTVNNQNIGDILDTAYSQSVTSDMMKYIVRGGGQMVGAGYLYGQSLNSLALAKQRREGTIPTDVTKTIGFKLGMENALGFWLPKVMSDALGNKDILNFFPRDFGVSYRGKPSPIASVAPEPENRFTRTFSGYEPITFKKPGW